MIAHGKDSQVSVLSHVCQRRPASSPHGFTLIEIMIAIGVLALGMTAVLGLLAAGTEAHRKAMTEAEVGTIADSLLSDYHSQLKDTILTEDLNGTDLTRPEYPGIRYDATFTELTETEVHVKLVIKRGQGKNEKTDTFNTIFIKQPY